jgi:hypothetical protein
MKPSSLISLSTLRSMLSSPLISSNNALLNGHRPANFCLLRSRLRHLLQSDLAELLVLVVLLLLPYPRRSRLPVLLYSTLPPSPLPIKMVNVFARINVTNLKIASSS